MKPAVLVMGAGTFQVGLIRFLKKYSYEVHVITNDLSNVGLLLADTIHQFSYLDLDKTLEIAEETNAIQILSVASESGLSVQAKVQKLKGWIGLDPEYINFFANKFKYKKLLAKYLVETPEVALLSSGNQLNQFIERYKDGVILKPARGSGSRDVRLLRTGNHFDIEGVLTNSSSEYLIEEYIDGTEYGGDFIVCNGKLLFYYPTVKSKNESWVPTGHVVLKNVSNYEVLRSFITKVTEKVPMQDGIYNVDIIVRDRKPYLIDLSPRIGGNCIPDLIYYSWQVDEWNFLLNMLLNKKSNVLTPKWQKPHGVYITGASFGGKLKRYLDHKFENQHALVEVFWSKKEGEEVLPFDQGANHIGYIIYSAENDDEILLLQKNIESFQWFELTPVN